MLLVITILFWIIILHCIRKSSKSKSKKNIFRLLQNNLQREKEKSQKNSKKNIELTDTKTLFEELSPLINRMI